MRSGGLIWPIHTTILLERTTLIIVSSFLMQRFRDYLSNPSKIFLCWYLVSTKAQLALALLKNVPKANWSSFSTSFIDTGSSVLFFFPAFTACMTSLVISLMSFNSLVQTLIFCSFSLSLVPEEEKRDDMIIHHRLTPLPPPSAFLCSAVNIYTHSERRFCEGSVRAYP